MGKKSLRESMKDPNYRGEDYNADEKIQADGPLKNRKCTDCLFLILFIAFIFLISYISNYAL
jgi:hypothetical protein